MKMVIIYIIDVGFPYPESEFQHIRTMSAVNVMLFFFQILVFFQET